MREYYKNSFTWKDSDGDEVILGVIPPEDHSDNADDVVRDLIRDYAADSSKNPSSWKDYTAGEFPRISVTEVEISPEELDEILSLERGAADTASGSLNYLLMECSTRKSK